MAYISESARRLADFVWNRWEEQGVKPKLKYVELLQLARLYLEECEKREIPPESLDFAEIVKAKETYDENKDELLDLLRSIKLTKEEMEEQGAMLALQELEQLLDELESRKEDVINILKAKGYTVSAQKEAEDQLLKLNQEIEKLERRINKLLEEKKYLLQKHEVEKARLESEIRELQERLAKAPKIRLQFLKDYTPDPRLAKIVHYKAGQVIETTDREWAYDLIAKGIAKEVLPEEEKERFVRSLMEEAIKELEKL